MAAVAGDAYTSTIQPARTQTIVELEGLLSELRQIEAEESLLLDLAQDRQAQASVFNELARIEEQQRTIMAQLNFVKKQRVVDKARQIAAEQRKLVQLMQEAADAEAASAGQAAPSAQPPWQTSLRSSGSSPGSNVSLQSGYFARSDSAQNLAAAGSAASYGTRSDSRQSGSAVYGHEQSRLAPVHTGTTPKAALRTPENNDVDLKKAVKRAREEAHPAEDPTDSESDFGREAKRHAGGKREPIVVSGGLPGFKIAKDLYNKSFVSKN